MNAWRNNLSLTFATSLFCFTLALPGLSGQQGVSPELRIPAESTSSEVTASFEGTLAYLSKLQADFPEMYLGFNEVSSQGRPLLHVVVSRERAFTGRLARKLNKPIVFLQCNSPSGETECKDAALILLREMSMEQHRAIVDGLTLVFVPVLNVDGHERTEALSGLKQAGLLRRIDVGILGSGLDLDRDYLKLSTPEVRSLVGLMNEWRPHLLLTGIATPSGAGNRGAGRSFQSSIEAPAPLAAWLHGNLPAAPSAKQDDGSLLSSKTPQQEPGQTSEKGSPPPAPAWLPSSYYLLRNRPTAVAETYADWPYRRRVLSVRAFFLTLLEEVAQNPTSLLEAVEQAEAATITAGKPCAPPSEIVLRRESDNEANRLRTCPGSENYGIATTGSQPLGPIGTSNMAELKSLSKLGANPASVVTRPRGYLILPGWPPIEERLAGHGLRVESLTEPALVEAEALLLSNPKTAGFSFQGLFRTSAEVKRERRQIWVPSGSLWIPADQADFNVAAQLLEPEAPDSLFSWGLLSSIFEEHACFDRALIEKIASESLKDPRVAEEWSAALADEELAHDPEARCRWWQHTVLDWHGGTGVLPYFRVVQAPTLTTKLWR